MTVKIGLAGAAAAALSALAGAQSGSPELAQRMRAAAPFRVPAYTHPTKGKKGLPKHKGSAKAKRRSRRGGNPAKG